jgi:hypothetical protein
MKIQDLLYWALVHGDSILFWVLTALGGLAARLVLAHVKNTTINGVVGRALNEIGDAVLMIGHTYVGDLKAASADGTLTDAEKTKAKADAIDVAKKNIGADGLAKLAKVLGIDDLDHWLGTKVESAVASVAGSELPKVKLAAPAPLPDPR